MNIELITQIYFSIVFLILLTTAVASVEPDMLPDEIENFYDWLFYGLFWIIIVFKYFIKFIVKVIKL